MEAFVYKHAIDQATYEAQKVKLDEEIALARMAAHAPRTRALPGCTCCLALIAARFPVGPRRLVWPRTSAFHADNTGSNPVGDTSLVLSPSTSPATGPGLLTFPRMRQSPCSASRA